MFNSISEFMSAAGVNQSLYMGSLPRVARNAQWNPGWHLMDPNLAGPRNFAKRYGFVDVSSDNPNWTGEFPAELYSAGSMIGERLSPQAVQILANDPSNPFNLANGQAHQVTAEELADLTFGADPKDPSRLYFDTTVAPMLAVKGQPGPQTLPTGGTGPVRLPDGGAPAPLPPPPPAPAPLPAPAPPLAPQAPGQAGLADMTLRQALEARFPGKGDAYAAALGDLDGLGSHPDPGKLLTDLLPLFGASLGAYGPMVAMVLTMALSAGK